MRVGQPHIGRGVTGIKCNGPIEVLHGGWSVQCTDPQGAIFALVGTRSHNGIGYFERAAPAFDELVAAGIARPPLESGDPLEAWPDLRLPHGIAVQLIDEDRGEA